MTARVERLPKWVSWAAVGALAGAAARAHAHADDVGKPPEVLVRTWTADPLFVLPALALAVIFAVGVLRLRARAGVVSRSLRRRTVAFAGGLLVSGASLCTPVDAVGAALFSMHMVQHLLMMLVAAPLFALARPEAVLLWGLPDRLRRRLGRALHRRRPLGAALRRLFRPAWVFAAYSVALWIWHVPALYEAALLDDRVHAIEHGAFLLTSWAFWRIVVDAGRRHGAGHGIGVLFAFGGAVQGAVLGALLTVATVPLYRAHAGGPEGFGLTLLEDQQLAGLAMWVPASIVYVAAGVLSLKAWLRASEAATRRGAAAWAPASGGRRWVGEGG